MTKKKMKKTLPEFISDENNNNRNNIE